MTTTLQHITTTTKANCSPIWLVLILSPSEGFKLWALPEAFYALGPKQKSLYMHLSTFKPQFCFPYFVCLFWPAELIRVGRVLCSYPHPSTPLHSSNIRHEDFRSFVRSSVRPCVCNAQTTPPGFWNGVDWRALVESRPPNIGKLRG